MVFLKQRALETLGFSAEDVTGLFRIVAAVLKMGNLSFHSVTNMDGTQSCSIANDYGIGAYSLRFDEIKQIFILTRCAGP